MKLQLLLALLIAGSLSSSAATARTPVLLELFTSEGCSSCPPADRLLQSLDKSQPIAGADLIVLSEHVDYWNHGGWSDPFSSAAFSERQSEYAKVFGRDEVYTPQLVVDGSAELVGSDESAARAAIGKAVGRSKLSIEVSHAVRDGDHLSLHLEVAPGNARPSLIYVAVADNEDRSQVSRGENAGRALQHVAVVRTLASVGTLSNSGFSKDLSVPCKAVGTSGLRVVAFVQEPGSRRILAVTQAKL